MPNIKGAKKFKSLGDSHSPTDHLFKNICNGIILLSIMYQYQISDF